MGGALRAAVEYIHMFRSLDKWLPAYLGSVLRRPRRVEGPRHLMFCIADHFEPLRGGASRETAAGIVRKWVEEYPAIAGGFRDSDGMTPRHTFFYPQEEYDSGCLDLLAGLCRQGYGEVEIHLHHRNDTPEGMKAKLVEFRDCLRNRHGLLGADREGRIRYGFIHGNWALCNSRPDGDWCGVNEELGILRDTGCYADFTFPSAPSPTQPRMANTIYRSVDRPGGGGCERGIEVGDKSQVSSEHPTSNIEVDGRKTINHSSSLMLITGPLALDWRRRKWGVVPRLENGAITAVNPPLPSRIDLWAKLHIHVLGRPEWVFVKVYAHGGIAEDASVLLGDAMRRAHEHLRARYNDGKQWLLHYVTARELYNIARAAEEGESGNPGRFRDYEIKGGDG